MKKNKDPFRTLSQAAVGIGTVGIATGVGASIAAKAPVGTPGLTGGFNTLAGFAPIVATGVGAKAVLDVLPKGKGVKIKGKRIV